MNKPKATIQVNLGTSDLAVKIEDRGFIPLWDRSEPNDEATQESWRNRSQIIVEQLCCELDVETRIPKGRQLPFEFIKLTQKIADVYKDKDKSEKWQDRLYPSRLLGIIKKAQEKFEISEVTVFVTRQEPIHESDSYFLFEILEKWVKEKTGITITPAFIPSNIDLRKDVDELSDYYYKQIQAIDTQKVILISRKGGTPAMINALNQQIALSSIDRKIILIDPQLDVDRVLAGEPSPCQLASYWKYIRNQKYEAVQQLLERWDFDGARVILERWQKYLGELIDLGVVDRELKKNKSFIDKNTKILDLTCAYLNLDSAGTLSGKKINPKRKDYGIFNNFEYEDSDRLLNLYAQCQIFWDINQVANFLFRLASFGEEVLHYLITNLDGIKYFDKEHNPNDWLLKPRLRDRNEQLWLEFQRLEIENNSFTKIAEWRDNHKKFRLPGRFSKRNFLEALINVRGKSEEIKTWKDLSDNFQSLDYWISLRNKVTHSAEGASKAGMAQMLQKDRNPESQDEKALNACKRDDILPTIEKMKEQTQRLSKQRYQFDSDFFIYDEVRTQVIEDLINS